MVDDSPMTVFTNNLPRILIHARGRMIPQETRFWERLRHELQSLGYDLWLIGHNLAQEPMNVPLLKVRNGLDAVTHYTKNEGWSAWFSLTGDLNEDKLLERERMWRGIEQDNEHQERRRRALYYYKNFYTVALKIIKPVLTVIWNGYHPQEMILDQLARDCHCPVAYIERAPFPQMIHVDQQGVLGGSRIAQQNQWNWSSKENQSYWHDALKQLQSDYCESNITWWEQPTSLGENKIRQKFNIPSDKKIVLFAGQVDQDIQTLLYSPLFKSNLDAFQWISKRLKHKKEVFILGKHHPKSSTPMENYQNVIDSTGVNGIWTNEASLEDCLSIADRVVAVNSTILYESMMRGIPILSLGNSLLSGKDIAYEINHIESHQDQIDAWLSAENFQNKQENWLDFGAYLLATDLFTMDVSEKSDKFQNAEQLANKIIKFASNNQFFDQIDIDSMISQFLESSSFCVNRKKYFKEKSIKRKGSLMNFVMRIRSVIKRKLFQGFP
ncbi:MAG: hypothetical protein ACOCQ4_03155 [bacterium]